MLNPTLKYLSIGAALLFISATSQAATPPNLYELNGTNLHISYSTTGIDGKPHFSYQNASRTLSFSGDQIRKVKTEIGTLVTVTLTLTVDNGSTAFSILLPNVNLDSTKQAAITTDGIITKHKFSPIPSFNKGQVDNYTFYKLTGKASFVYF